MPTQVNQQAITNWQNWLNQTFPPGPWVPIDGFLAQIEVTPINPNSATFNANRGYLLKSFVNTLTGEVKSFDARKFYV